jgi:hypothetical protein
MQIRRGDRKIIPLLGVLFASWAGVLWASHGWHRRVLLHLQPLRRRGRGWGKSEHVGRIGACCAGESIAKWLQMPLQSIWPKPAPAVHHPAKGISIIPAGHVHWCILLVSISAYTPRDSAQHLSICRYQGSLYKQLLLHTEERWQTSWCWCWTFVPG